MRRADVGATQNLRQFGIEKDDVGRSGPGRAGSKANNIAPSPNVARPAARRAAADEADSAPVDFAPSYARPAARLDPGVGRRSIQRAENETNGQLRDPQGIGPVGDHDFDALPRQDVNGEIIDAYAIATDDHELLGGLDDARRHQLRPRRPADATGGRASDSSRSKFAPGVGYMTS